jgi:hypothetical protein
MIQALAIWQTVKALAKRVPWQAWAILALSAAWAIDRTTYGAERYSDGRESVLADLRTAEAEAKEKALRAIAGAGEAGIARAEAFDQQQEALRNAIDAAEKGGGNALDSIF